MRMEFNVSQKIAVYYAHEEIRYTSRILDVSENFIYIDIPIYDHNEAVFIKNQKITIHYYTPQGEFEFDSVLVSREKIPVVSWCIVKPDPQRMRFQQQRENVRVRTIMDIHVVTDEWSFSSLTQDLSAGGVSFILPLHYPVKESEQMKISFDLEDDGGRIEVMTSVLRCRYLSEIHKNLISVSFGPLTERNIQRIVNYVYRCQLRERRVKKN